MFVFDRTAADVSKAAALIAKIREVTFAGLTADEQAEWLAGMKAVENYTDWNRQNGNIATAKDTVKSLGYSAVLTPVPTATADDVPTLADVNALEGNLSALASCGLTMPTDWESSKAWTAGNGPAYTDWNRWERNIALLEEMAGKIAAAWYYSGELYGGEV
jgi:hypothetical protein